MIVAIEVAPKEPSPPTIMNARGFARARCGDCADARAGDHILVMSNGGFGGIHDKLLQRLAARGP